MATTWWTQISGQIFFLSSRLFNNKNQHVEFFQMYRFPQWQIYVLLIIDDSPIRKWKLRLQSQDNSFEAKDMSFIFLPLSSSSFHLRHHRIVTYGKQKYSFVPHSHAILHFCAFGLLSFPLGPPFCLLSEFFNSSSFIHSVLLCEKCI